MGAPGLHTLFLFLSLCFSACRYCDHFYDFHSAGAPCASRKEARGIRTLGGRLLRNDRFWKNIFGEPMFSGPMEWDNDKCRKQQAQPTKQISTYKCPAGIRQKVEPPPLTFGTQGPLGPDTRGD